MKELLLYIAYLMLPVLLAVVKLVCLLVAIAYYTLAERKVMAAFQRRVGPNVVGPLGLLQPLADGLKLAGKEFVIPSHSNSRIFVVAAMLTLLLSLVTWTVIPLNLFDHGGRFGLQTALCVGLVLPTVEPLPFEEVWQEYLWAQAYTKEGVELLQDLAASGEHPVAGIILDTLVVAGLLAAGVGGWESVAMALGDTILFLHLDGTFGLTWQEVGAEILSQMPGSQFYPFTFVNEDGAVIRLAEDGFYTIDNIEGTAEDYLRTKEILRPCSWG